MFAQHAAGAIEVERSLHESFFREFGLSEEEVAATPMAPTNLAYTSYLALLSPTAARSRRRSARYCRATESTGRSVRSS